MQVNQINFVLQRVILFIKICRNSFHFLYNVMTGNQLIIVKILAKYLLFLPLHVGQFQIYSLPHIRCFLHLHHPLDDTHLDVVRGFM